MFIFLMSLLIVEKFEASSLSTLYDLKHLLSAGKDEPSPSIAPLECDGRGFILMHKMAGRKVSMIHVWGHN